MVSQPQRRSIWGGRFPTSPDSSCGRNDIIRIQIGIKLDYVIEEQVLPQNRYPLCCVVMDRSTRRITVAAFFAITLLFTISLEEARFAASRSHRQYDMCRAGEPSGRRRTGEPLEHWPTLAARNSRTGCRSRSIAERITRHRPATSLSQAVCWATAVTRRCTLWARLDTLLVDR